MEVVEYQEKKELVEGVLTPLEKVTPSTMYKTEFTPALITEILSPILLQNISNVMDEKFNILYEYIECLNEEIKNLKPKEETITPPVRTAHVFDMSREVPDGIAEEEIKIFLRKLRDEGAEKFDLLDVVFELNLPPEQIERVIEKLRRD